MKNLMRGAFCCFAAASIALTGCAKKPDNEQTTKALAQAIEAELEGSSLASMPLNKSIATNFDEGRQFVIARKVGNVSGRSNCSKFDITVSRPSSQFSLFGKGDSNWKTGVEVCVP